MIRSTTPTHIFKLPTLVETLKDALITYAQNGQIVVEKKLEDCIIDQNKITVKLTQEETNKFSEGNVKIQMRVLTTGGSAFASQIFTLCCHNVLDDEVLT